MKDAYYFPHDSNAKDDPKCIQLIEEQGVEGYGIFWILIETLRSQTDYMAPIAILSGLARRYNTTADKMKNVVLKYDLFTVTEDDKFFYSEAFMRRMEMIDAKRKKLSEAGKKGNSIRWESPPNRKAIATQSQVKESKVNKSKEKERKEAIRSPESHADFEEYQTHHEKMSNFAKQYGAMDGLTPREIDHYIVKRGSDDWEKPQGNIIKRITQTNIRADMLYMKRQGWLREPKAEETENTFNGGVMN
jgi:hypothetical protein